MVGTAATEVATASTPDPLLRPSRPGNGAARARTEELYASHNRVVLGLCRALLRDRSEAEDAAQQTFLSAQRALENGSVPREPAAWLATIARNECWARIRSRMREPLPTADVERESSSADPVTEAIQRADLAALWRAIAELPKQQRDALLLREFGGLSYDELAEALAVTTPAVESLLFRARQGVRTRLRTAYAALSGAGWAEWAARLIAGGSAPAAAKVAAVGMSAAVVTGGAVVTPRVLHHEPRPKPAATTTTRRHTPPVPILASQAEPPAPARAVQPHRVPVHRSDDGAQGSDDHGSSGRRSRGGEDENGQHGTTTVVREQAAETTEVDEPEHGGNSGPGGGGEDEPAGEPDNSGHGGGGSDDSSGHGSGDGEGMVATTTNPPLTVTIPTVEDPLDEPPGDDH